MTIDRTRLDGHTRDFPQLHSGDIDRHFPKPSYRKGQREAIEFAVNAFRDGKTVVVLECPTGSGKSPIGMAIADMVPTSYYLTITKVLQDQLVGDFQGNLVELKGRNAYPCTFYDRIGDKLVKRGLWTASDLDGYKAKNPDCGSGYCRTKWNRNSLGDPEAKAFRCEHCFMAANSLGVKGQLSSLPPGMEHSACPYYEQVSKAIAARKVVMNFSSFLYQTQMTKRFNTPRNLMILDEAHNIEQQLLNFVSFSITDAHLSKYGVFIPELNSALEYALWMEEACVHDMLWSAIKKAREDENPKLEDELARIMKKYRLFMDQIAHGQDEWVCEYEEKKQRGSVTHRKVTLKPVFAQRFAHELLFKYAQRTLLMSATILDVNVLCRSLGIDRSCVAAYRVRNNFPKENRPIYVRPVAKMTGGKSRMHQWAPKLVQGVNDIVKSYEGKKGIIHTHNFAIMDHLLTRCDPEVKDRFIHQRDYPDKRELLQEHARRQNSVIIAPAMHEGIDLAGDLSRFQIICKVPFANCFDDEQLARRVEVDRRYYIWLTAVKLCQAYGRSVRSEDDYADTFILDASIHRFLKDSDKMLPGWMKEAIIYDA